MKRVYKPPFKTFNDTNKKTTRFISDSSNAFVCECDSVKNEKEVVMLLNNATSSEFL